MTVVGLDDTDSRERGLCTTYVAAEIAERAGAGRVEVMRLDLADLASVRSFTDGFADRYDRLDVLVNTAGVILTDRQETVDGFEATIATNHLGPFLLTVRLLPLLRASAPARIVNVASVAHVGADLDPDDLHHERRDYQAMAAYRASKLANILFTRELARRLDGSGVTVNACHPGTVASGFGLDGDTHGIFPVLLRIAAPFMKGPAHGAVTPIHLAGSPEVEGDTGGYYTRRRRTQPSPAARDGRLARRLWEASADAVGLDAHRVSGGSDQPD
ncbi:MAG: SDR family NAD(P)-dependent oxidoreductase [Actinobacteria bacterium]|nr:SDR family NAD(P)-dependent oxidoreductase [Actinomycetota bacterium]